jgi:hypothetical protein
MEQQKQPILHLFEEVAKIPIKRYHLSPNARITNLGGFDIKKPLSWEFYKDGKKLEYGKFEIYKSQGVLFYSVLYTPKSVQKREKFIGNEKNALSLFNNIANGFVSY